MEGKTKGVKRTFECAFSSDDVQRDYGDLDEDFIVKSPGFVAATDGDEPISFSCPDANPEMVTHDPAEREKALVEAYKEATGKNIYDVIEAAKRERAQRISLQKSMEESPIVLLVDFAIPQDNDKLITERLVEEEKETHNINTDPISILNLGYLPCTYDCSFGTIHAFKRDSGDFFEIMLYKGVILNRPGLVVAAVGGIPDELKIKDGLSFSFRCPTYKISKTLPLDHSERHKAYLDVFDEIIEKDVFTRTLEQAYIEARGKSLISNQSEEVEKEKMDDEGQESWPMIEVNVDPSRVYTFASSREDIFRGYSLRIAKGNNGTVKLLERDLGDHVEVLHYKGVVYHKPGLLTVAAGGVPDELKVSGGISFWYPCPVIMIPKDLPCDLAEREKALRDAYNEALGHAATIKAAKEAYIKYMCSWTPKQSEKMDQQSLAMIEVNVAARVRINVFGSRRTRSSSDELNKESNVER